MSTTTMHFGPEWMRTKHQSLPRQHSSNSPPSSTTYAALASTNTHHDTHDTQHPFRYSKEDLLRIYRDGDSKYPLSLEIERWDGVVRNVGEDPVALRELSDAEKKLLAGPLNSELRRRPSQSTEFLSPLTTSNLSGSRLNHHSPASASSPHRERFVGLKRRDSGANATDHTIPSAIPKKPSLSTLQNSGLSPRDSTPRARVGYTSSFDGVLTGGGDSWSSRRRTSDTSFIKQGSATERDGGEDGGNKTASGIQEEKEEDPAKPSNHRPADKGGYFPSNEPYTSADGTPPVVSNGLDPAVQPLNNSAPPAPARNDIGPPPGLVDLNAIEWSYKDPQGQVQGKSVGPFRADVMQRWYNEGYFSDDLPMKRTHLDTEWFTVETLTKRATGSQIFLCQLAPPETAFTEPFQPAPIRSLRTSALESYLNSAGTDSPASSFAASLGNPSPDPQLFNGQRDPRLAGLQGSAYPGYGTGGGVSLNGYMYGGNTYASHDAWFSPANNANASFGVGIRDSPAERLYHTMEPVGALDHNQNHASLNIQSLSGHYQQPDHGYQHANYLSQDSSAGTLRQFDSYNHGASNYNPAVEHPHGNYFGYRGLASDLAPQPTALNSDHHPVASPWGAIPEQHSRQLTPLDIPTGAQAIHSQSVTQSPWETVDDSQPVLPTTTSALSVISSPEPTPITNVSNAAPVPPAVATPEQIEAEVVTSDLAKLKIDANEAPAAAIPGSPPAPTPVAPAAPAPAVTPPALTSVPDVQHQQPPAAKLPAKPAPPPVEVPVIPSPTPTQPRQEAAVSPAPKSAWAIDDDQSKKRGSAPSVSLREIQEAESKKAEARKVAERNREKLARAAAATATAAVDSSSSKEDGQTFTASWGLPTSQAGARGTAKDLAISSPSIASVASPGAGNGSAPSPTPVWTTPVKQPAAKKTMKEILEEEEKRQKAAAAREAAANAAPPKRAYAETTTKTVSPSPAVGGAWTTVGPGGKTNSTAAPIAPRPATLPSTPSFSAAAAVSARPAAPSARPVQSVTKPRPAVKEDTTYTPSHDFLKWLTESLKGLNSSVNEEFVSMLLSFPLDPDPTTVEIISDTIYSNSTTLDGRRFASEFIAKRKADATTRSQAPGGSKLPPKPVSIADVVKAAPKASQAEWGFKVVNKKKKGGRA